MCLVTADHGGFRWTLGWSIAAAKLYINMHRAFLCARHVQLVTCTDALLDETLQAAVESELLGYQGVRNRVEGGGGDGQIDKQADYFPRSSGVSELCICLDGRDCRTQAAGPVLCRCFRPIATSSASSVWVRHAELRAVPAHGVPLRHVPRGDPRCHPRLLRVAR
jgi:hypothetical protein